MSRTHERIAEGIRRIRETINSEELVMSVGLDGAILYHLFNPYGDLDKTVYISSKAGMSDTEKFGKILEYADARTVYALDLRTKTGSLGEMLKQMSGDWKNKTGKGADVRYTVLFDPNNRAGIRAFNEELSDEERIIWMDGETYKKVFVNQDGEWSYNISHNFIKGLPDVKGIRKLILESSLYRDSLRIIRQ